MSVVNKMLQDLEKRQQQAQSADYQPPARGRRPWWLFGVLPLALLGFAAYWLLPDWLARISGEESRQALTGNTTIAAPVAEPVKIVEPDERQTQPVPGVSDAADLAQTSQPTPEPSGPEATAGNQATERAGIAESAGPAERVEQPGPQKAAPVLKVTSGAGDADSQWALLKLQVQQAMADKRPRDAISALKRMLAMQPDNHPVRMRLAALMHDTGMQAQSGLILEEGVTFYPDQSGLRLMLARWLAGNDRHQQALQLLQEQQPDLLGHPDYYAFRAQLAQQQDALELAVSDYLLLSQYQPQRFTWRLGLAVALDRAGKLQAALEQYRWLRQQTLPPEARQFVQQRLQALGG